MATRGTPLPNKKQLDIQRLRLILSLRQTAREVDVCKDTVIKYARMARRSAKPKQR